MSTRASSWVAVTIAFCVLPACKNLQDKERELTAECKRELPCKKNGLCTGVCTPEPCVCAARGNADCTQSSDCPAVGQCTARDGKCVVASNADCAQTPACKATGICTAKDGVCVVGSDADCSQSNLCRDQRKCKLKGSTCFDATFNAALLDPSRAGETAPEKFKVKFATGKGEFVVEVNRAWAPLAAERFYNLVKIGYYNENAFYRVDNAQAEFGVHGNPEVSAVWQSVKLRDDPPKQPNDRGTLAFPRPYPNSRWAPIVIHLKDNRDLNQVGYAPFGKVIQGMNVVDALVKAAPGSKPVELEKVLHGGNAFLKATFPQMEYINSATLL